jgi:twinkle protein
MSDQQGLNKLRRFTRDNNIHTWLVAHPSKFLVKGQKRDVPTLYDIADSAHFYNKADYGVVVYRPDDQSSRVELHVQKVRFYTTGKKGTCGLDYDVQAGRYTESAYVGSERVNEYAF